MKQNNQNRRARGRGPRKPHGMGGGGGQHKGQGYEGGGHETRVRGNAYQVLEKYLQLARDAGSAGDRVAAENFLQHADHYYRVLSAMNDGQRPRVGGRELSVADVNVQNVSQGLSAAMYSSGSGGQGLPGMADTGNQDDEEPGPGQGNQGQGNQANSNQGQGNQSQGNQSQGNQSQGNQSQGNQSQGGQGQGGQGQERQERGPRPDRGQDRHHQRHNQGQGHNQGASRQQGQQGVAQGQPISGNVAANGHEGGYTRYADVGEQPPVAYAAAPEPVAVPAPVDEQPDYPEELLPVVAPAAVIEGDAAPEAQARPPRGPRGRLRGPARRGPKPAEGPVGGQEPTE